MTRVARMDRVWGCHRTSTHQTPRMKDFHPMKHIETWNAPSTWAMHMAVGQNLLKCPGEQKPRQPTNWECCPQTKTYLTKSSTFILVYPGGVHNFSFGRTSFLAAASNTSFYRCEINPPGEVSSERFQSQQWRNHPKSLGFRWIVPNQSFHPGFCWSKFPDSSLINHLKSSAVFFPRVDLHCHGTGRLRQSRCPALLALCTGHATCSGSGGCRTQQGLGEAMATRSLLDLWPAGWDWRTGYDGCDLTAQGGGGSFKDRKPIGEVSFLWCMAERIH